MHKKRLVLWLFLSFFLILGSGSVGYLATSQSSSPSLCDFVERFEILNRATEITLDDKDMIQALLGFGPSTVGKIEDSITENGRISTLEQLFEALGNGKAAFTLRIFFRLEGDETCEIDS